MKATLVIVLAVGLGLACTTLAAPVKLEAKSDVEIQLLKAFVGQALVQEATEGEGMTKEFCRLITGALKTIGVAPKKDLCDDIDDDDSEIPDGGYTSDTKTNEWIFDVLKGIFSPTDLIG